MEYQLAARSRVSFRDIVLIVSRITHQGEQNAASSVKTLVFVTLASGRVSVDPSIWRTTKRALEGPPTNQHSEHRAMLRNFTCTPESVTSARAYTLQPLASSRGGPSRERTPMKMQSMVNSSGGATRDCSLDTSITVRSNGSVTDNPLRQTEFETMRPKFIAVPVTMACSAPSPGKSCRLRRVSASRKRFGVDSEGQTVTSSGAHCPERFSTGSGPGAGGT